MDKYPLMMVKKRANIDVLTAFFASIRIFFSHFSIVLFLGKGLIIHPSLPRYFCFALGLLLFQPAYSLEPVWRGAMIGSIITYLTSNPLAMDQLGFEVGHHSESDIIALKLNNAWKLQQGLIQKPNYRLDSQLRFNIGFWNLGSLSDQGEGFPRHQRNSTNVELGIHFAHHLGHLPMTIETLIGITYISTHQLGKVKYGSNFGFVNGLILGYKQSEKTVFTLSYLHYSNNDLAKDNPPDNFIYFGYQHQYSH